MPLADIRPYLEDACKKKYALGCFNVFNTETLEGVIGAAIEKSTPIVCAIYEPQFQFADLESFKKLVKDMASKTDIPIILHLDHTTEKKSIINAIRLGFSAVMFDGPIGASFEEKAEKTKEVAEIAHNVGISVEAELGYITRVGLDDTSFKQNLADPSLAKEFVEYTGIDILAPAIGSVHGMGTQEATLDLELLKSIKEQTRCYLSLHGGSGVSDSVVQKSIDIGISKASVYTKLSKRAVERIQNVLKSEDLDISQILNEVREGFKEIVVDRLELLRSTDICNEVKGLCQYCGSPRSWPKKDSGEGNHAALVEKISLEVLKKLKSQKSLS